MKSLKSLEKQFREENKFAKFEKMGLYYTTRSLMGIKWWTYAWLVGARGRGKSFAAMDTILSYVKRYGRENVKVYWMRISDDSVKAMIQNQARKAIDAILVRKYKLKLSTRNYTVYNDGYPLIDFYPLVSAAKKGKGVAEYDPAFLNNRPFKKGKRIRRYVFIVLDEFMMAEGVEKKSVGNPVAQFQIYMENILRDQERLDYPAVRVFGCANTVSECSDFLAQLAGFIPEEPGRFKLKRRHMIVDNIPNTQAYIDKRKKSYTADIMDFENDSNYTNILKRDIALLAKNIRLQKPSFVIKFSKNQNDWFTLWDEKIIRKWNGQSVKRENVIAMKRYLDEEYHQDMVRQVIEKYDSRFFMYSDLISQSVFASKLREIKK